MSEQEQEEMDFPPPRVKGSRFRKKPKDSQPIVQVEETKEKPTLTEMLNKAVPVQAESKTALTPPPPEKDYPHDSAYVHSSLKEKHTLGVLPTLNAEDKGNGATIIIIVLLSLCFVSAWGVAYEAQLSFTPHVQGQCPAPAVIEKGGCFTVETATNANGNTVTTLIPAGTLAP